MNTYVIGDVQGCLKELEHLLVETGYQQSSDHLWLVGDMINRGPDNVGVMELLLTLPNVTCVLGNHDLHFLAVALGQQTAKGGDTIQDMLASPRLDDYTEYLRHLPLLHRDEERGLVMVHAGLPPNLDITKCMSLAAEVEAVLRSDEYPDFLAGMYGNEPANWNPDLTGMDRLRLITNYFTRMRFCTEEGELELLHKMDTAPEGYAPWFNFERPDDVKVLFGHWAAMEGKVDSPHAIPLDTGCVWGRSLTAMRLEDGAFFSVPAQNKW